MSKSGPRKVLWQSMLDEAAKGRGPGETPEQAIARFLQTPRGETLYRQYCNAPTTEHDVDDDQDNEAAPGRPAMKVSAAEECALGEIEFTARHFQEQDPSLTFAQAYKKVLEADPSMYSRYERARMLREFERRRLPRLG